MSQDVFWLAQLKSHIYPQTNHHSQKDWLSLYNKSTLEAEVGSANKKEDSQKEAGGGADRWQQWRAVPLRDTAFKSHPACYGLTNWTHLRKVTHRTLQLNHFTFLHKTPRILSMLGYGQSPCSLEEHTRLWPGLCLPSQPISPLPSLTLNPLVNTTDWRVSHVPHLSPLTSS